MNVCPRCQKENPLGVPSCQSCGTRLSSWGSMTMGAQGSGRPNVTIRVVRADGGAETAFSVRKDQAIAGTGGDVLLAEDPFAQRHQARFFFEGARLFVEDVGGGNGVFARLRASEQSVAPGQHLRCGRQLLILEALPPEPAETPRTWGSPDPGYRARLVQVFEGGRRGDAWPLKLGDNLIGREVGDVTFPGDGFVSGRHALVQVGSDGVKLRDLGSSNGTFLRIGQPIPLDHGDQLLIGRQLLKLDIHAPPS